MRDYGAETEARVAFIRQRLEESGAAGIVYGNSGGKDSALVGILCHMACEDTVGIAMPCESRRNYEEDMADGLEVAEKFGIPCRKLELTEVKRLFAGLLGQVTELNAAASTNMNPRLRMTALYAVAAAENRLVAGTGNLSERYVGYFTKWGDGACDFNPIGDLTVTEVYEFLRYLEAPEAILTKAPSAGLFEGQTDEKEMGVAYAEIDAVIAGEPVRPEAEAIIARRHAASAHKRRLPPVYGEEESGDREDGSGFRAVEYALWKHHGCVLMEEELKGFPLLMFNGVRPKSAVLARDDRHFRLLLRFSDGRLRLHRTVMDAGELQEAFEEYDEERLAELSGFTQLLAADKAVSEQLAQLYPAGVPELMCAGLRPWEQHREKGVLLFDRELDCWFELCGTDMDVRPGDRFGLFAERAVWLKKQDGTACIIGRGRIDPLYVDGVKTPWDEPLPLGMKALRWFFRPGQTNRLIVGEGITEINGCLYLDNDRDSALEELVLPATMKKMPRIDGYVRKVTVPPSVETIDFVNALFTDCGGHCEPVTLAVKELVLPAQIRPVKDSLPFREPVAYLETVRLYGDRPVSDLEAWYDSGFFGPEIGVRLLYPAAWDGDDPGSYQRMILRMVRYMKPERPVFGMDPGAEPWTEEDYQRLEMRLLPY